MYDFQKQGQKCVLRATVFFVVISTKQCIMKQVLDKVLSL